MLLHVILDIFLVHTEVDLAKVFLLAFLSILAHFPKVGLCHLHVVCVSVYPAYQLLNA
jgi:hypothetical protein